MGLLSLRLCLNSSSADTKTRASNCLQWTWNRLLSMTVQCIWLVVEVVTFEASLQHHGLSTVLIKWETINQVINRVSINLSTMVISMCNVTLNCRQIHSTHPRGSLGVCSAHSVRKKKNKIDEVPTKICLPVHIIRLLISDKCSARCLLSEKQ